MVLLPEREVSSQTFLSCSRSSKPEELKNTDYHES